ncbi:hypothetical protein GCM10022240_27760 [Microbacterium kribbense]|uniref:Cell division initiation protein n=1 Tax=Microbacterium kribbense TaxID=433645 RepID=A0ABP7GU05_9MICO
MPDQTDSPDAPREQSAFDRLIAESTSPGTFSTAFRGYDKDEVDRLVTDLNARLRATGEESTKLRQYQQRASTAVKQSRAKAEKLATEVARLQAEAADDDTVAALRGELTAAQLQVAESAKQVQALTDELRESSGESTGHGQFEEILRVAEEQASVLIRNATVQGERLLDSAREEIEKRRKDAQAEAEAIVSHAQHDAAQARLRIDTELTAHQARLEREAAHSAEKVDQAQQESGAIRSEAEKGAAALRSMVARETSRDRAEAEAAVRELRVRALEFEASLSRRQDDAHQEFLVLHNQAVAHAERITQDANEQVAASLEHAQRVSAKADDFERLARSQAQQIEADARVRASELLDQARTKAQKIMELVTENSQSVLHDAEDRARQLRWQQHQLTSFMVEVRELIRPESSASSADAAESAEVPESVDADEPGDASGAADADAAEDAAEVGDSDARDITPEDDEELESVSA